MSPALESLAKAQQGVENSAPDLQIEGEIRFDLSTWPARDGKCGFRDKVNAIPGRTSKAFRDEDERDSGLMVNSDFGGKANGFSQEPGTVFTMSAE